jgi:ribosomal protein L21
MYAIVQTGGKQYKVQTGDQVKVEKLVGEPGSEIELDQVLAVATPEGLAVGKPLLTEARVKAITRNRGTASGTLCSGSTRSNRHPLRWRQANPLPKHDGEKSLTQSRGRVVET